MAKEDSLKIHDDKTEYIIIERRDKEYQPEYYEYMEVENHKYKRMQYLKYLGSIISQDIITQK